MGSLAKVRVDTQRRKIWWCFAILASFCLFANVQAAEPDAEAKLKAACIFNFAKYVKWPQPSFENETTPIKICLPPKHPFGELFNALKGKSVQGREVIAVELPDLVPPEKNGCHILFLSEAKKFTPGGTAPAILTVAGPGSPAMINFVTVDGKVKFEIYLTKARSAGLLISSQMLQLALNVIEEE